MKSNQVRTKVCEEHGKLALLDGTTTTPNKYLTEVEFMLKKKRKKYQIDNAVLAHEYVAEFVKRKALLVLLM